MFLANKYSKWYSNIIKAARARNNQQGYVENHHIIPKSLGGSDDADNIVALTAKEHLICHLLLVRMTVGSAALSMQRAAFMMTASNRNHQRVIVTSRTYARLKQKMAACTSALHKGRKRSAATRKRISEARKGVVSPNRGKRMSDEQRANLSKIHKGKTISTEMRAKLSAANMGKKRSEETKQRMRDAAALLSDEVRARMHRPKTDEEKQALSIKMKGRPSPLKGRASTRKDWSHTDESIAKMRAAHANRVTLECEHCGKSVQKPMHTRWHGDNCKQRPQPV